MNIDTDTHYQPIHWLDHVDFARAHRKVELRWRDGKGVFVLDGKEDRPFSELDFSLEARIPYMDDQEMDVQVLIPENRMSFYEAYADDPEVACYLARGYNDAAAEDCRGNDRFVGVAWVYLPEIEESVVELERSVRKLGLGAVKVMGKFGQTNLGSKTLWPFYQKAEELNVPVLVHGHSRGLGPGDPNPSLVGASDFGPEYGFLGPGGLGFPFTYMMTMTHLIMGGTMDQFPKLRFGFFEAGAGWLPYLMNRLDTYYIAEQRQGRVTGEIIPKRLPSSYFDHSFVTCMSKETYLGDTVRALPNHRIIVGTDFPHQDPNSTWPDTMSELRSLEGLGDEDLQRMLDTNARSLLAM